VGGVEGEGTVDRARAGLSGNEEAAGGIEGSGPILEIEPPMGKLVPMAGDAALLEERLDAGFEDRRLLVRRTRGRPAAGARAGGKACGEREGKQNGDG